MYKIHLVFISFFLNFLQLVSGSTDHTIRVWDLADGQGWSRGSCRLTITGHSGTRMSGKEKINWWVYTRLIDGSFKGREGERVQRIISCLIVLPLFVNKDTVRCLQANEKVIVSGSYDMTLRVWDLPSGTCRHTLRSEYSSRRDEK